MNELTFLEEKHEYKWGGQIVPSVTTIISHFFPVFKAKDMEWYRERGTAVHYACELDDRGILNIDTVRDCMLPFLNGWKKFKKDFKPEIKEIEKKVYSKRYRFAGTFDNIASISGKITLVDIKTSSSIDKITCPLQTAGYSILWNENHPAKEKIQKRLIVQLKENDYNLVWHDNPLDEFEFLALLTHYNLKKRKGLLKDEG